MFIEGELDTGDVYINGSWLDPRPASALLQFERSTPFAWGDMSAGAELLALAVLLRYLPMNDALSLRHKFLSEVVRTWPGDKNLWTYYDIRAWTVEATRELYYGSNV